jgi:aspartate carbamoyltransferase regulatory subunit
MALSLGLAGADFEGRSFVPPTVDLQFVTDRHPGEHKERSGSVDIRPIENGTVIDHVEGDPYVIAKIGRLLGFEERGDVFRMGVVEPIKRPGSRKGVMMIRDRILNEQELRLIATIAPGATVNDIQARRVVRKRDLHLPGVVEGLQGMSCSNHRCITRREYHEHIAPKAVRLGPAGTSAVKCFYCNNLMASHEMFSSSQF